MRTVDYMRHLFVEGYSPCRLLRQSSTAGVLITPVWSRSTPPSIISDTAAFAHNLCPPPMRRAKMRHRAAEGRKVGNAALREHTPLVAVANHARVTALAQLTRISSSIA